MNCFYHQDVAAIGICKACSKGLCSTCAADLEFGLACTGRCEDQVRRLNQLVERNMRIAPVSEQLIGAQPRSYLAAAAFSITAGSIFVAMGLSLDDTARLGVVGIGVLAIIGGVFQGLRAWRLKRTTGA